MSVVPELLGGEIEAATAGHAKEIVDPMLLTPSHQIFTGEVGIDPSQDLDVGLDLGEARVRDDSKSGNSHSQVERDNTGPGFWYFRLPAGINVVRATSL